MLNVDYLVVGSGLTGATIARILSDAGREVAVIDRREQFGGNVVDALHESGIRYNLYGPHYFRTGSQRIWDFAQRFSKFRLFEAKLLTFCQDRHWPWPLHQEHVQELAHGNWVLLHRHSPVNFEEAALNMMPEVIYRLFVKGYTEKQWGVPSNQLEPSLARRFDVRVDGDLRLSRKPFQGLPEDGYSAWIGKMLAGVECRSCVDYLSQRSEFKVKNHLIFTGPIDEFFEYKLGRLKYRGQRRTHKFFSDSEIVLPGVQVNYPDPFSFEKIRTIEWKWLDRSIRVKGSLITDETPFSPDNPGDYEYPFPDTHNRELYERYRRASTTMSDVTFCGRLGEYRYYDMDQAIGKAMLIAENLLHDLR